MRKILNENKNKISTKRNKTNKNLSQLFSWLLLASFSMFQDFHFIYKHDKSMGQGPSCLQQTTEKKKQWKNKRCMREWALRLCLLPKYTCNNFFKKQQDSAASFINYHK
jgi:hypothetical protein